MEPRAVVGGTSEFDLQSSVVDFEEPVLVLTEKDELIEYGKQS